MGVAATPAFDKGLYYEILHPLSAFSVGDVRSTPWKFSNSCTDVHSEYFTP